MTSTHPGLICSHDKFLIYNAGSIYDNILNQKFHRKKKLPANTHPGLICSHDKFLIYNAGSIYDNILNQKLHRKNKLPANIHQKETAHG